MAISRESVLWKKTALEDDTVEYFIFPKVPHSLSKSEVVKFLKEVKDSCMSIIQNDFMKYIWQNEPFGLHIPSEMSYTLKLNSPDKDTAQSSNSRDEKDVFPPFLWGRTCYGDCADDEWFIVYLLRRLTLEMAGLVIRLVDADGEFLLIEAADHVPDSYDPETAERRVYLHAGAVHLLPLTFPDETPDGLPVTMAAVEAVRDGGADTRATDELQRAIERKIDGYPGKITESHHRATVRLPAAAAALLHACPHLLPAAVQAFYLRDPIDLKACRSMRFFPPETCVCASITMTRTLYAQLVQQRYRPDARTGWQLPAVGDPLCRAADVGMKLACGLEILACRSRPGSDACAADPGLDELRDDVRWQRYMASLQQKRYFGEELEGSRQYCALLERARQYYVGHMLTEDRRSVPGDAIHQLLATVKVDHDLWKRREAQLPPADDESWLEVSSEQLDSLLQSQFQLEQQQPDQVAGELQDFLSRLSGLDGVEPDTACAGGGASGGGGSSRKTSRARKPSRKLSAAALRKISTLSQASTSSAMSSLSQKIDFNADSFTDAVRGMLDLGLDDDQWSDDDSSGMSSYGDEDGSAGLDELLDHPPSSDKQLHQLMAQMDDELRDSTLADSFVRATKAVRKESGASDSSGAAVDDVDTFQPVDVDLNAVQNLLQSLQGQTASAGPAQTLLQNMTKEKDTQ